MHGLVADPMVDQALKRSVLGGIPRDLLDQLLGTAMRLDIPAGSIVYREGDAPRCGY
jgi:hypothetical protein